METINLNSSQNFNKTVYFTSLGCSKNLVDSQVMLGHMGLDGYQIKTEPSEASVIVVNTCSFIEASKKESIDVILEMADYKNPEHGVCQALVIAGCMAQRYSEQLEKELPEADLIIGTGEYHKINYFLRALNEGKLAQKSFVEIPKFIHTEYDPRLNTSPSYMAWLKISEGCNRNCTFCIIPKLRGKLRSRTVESLTNEAIALSKNGVKELNLISQDLSDYGVDLTSENNISSLLTALSGVEGIEWIRLFYFYPDELSDEVIEKIASLPKVCKYLDMPVQHFSNNVLKRMNRKITGETIHARINKLKECVPGIAIRTSIIVGFPGETDEDFNDLLEGIKKAKFHHVGIFRYSDEEGTPAYKLGPKVPQDIIEERFDILYETQREIVREIHAHLVGQTVRVLIEGSHEETDMLIASRYQGQAPDIDGKVIINDLQNTNPAIGDFVNVLITESLDFDLVGRIV